MRTPLLVAAVVLGVAAVAKLRSPAIAVSALTSLGVRAGPALVRVFALLELALAVWCLGFPGRAAAAALMALYLLFAAITLLLARGGGQCGCFGDGDAPASWLHAAINGLFALVALGNVLGAPGGVDWLLSRPPAQAAVLLIGVLAAAYASVLAYTGLPRLWFSWSGR